MLTYSPRKPSQFPNWTFEHLDLDYDSASQSVWMSYKASSPPYYNLQTLTDMADVRESLRLLFASEAARSRWPIRYFVHASNKPGVFSLGGDLATFSASIRRRDRETLLHYAYACIDVIYGLATSFGLPIVTVSAIHGQCLAGGFEAALTADFLIAETHSKLGVPEVAFNTFPGMGAVTLLTRRLGSARAHEIISEGKVYSGDEMHAFGAIDLLVPDSTLREQALCWIMDGGEERWRRRLALAETRRICFPVSNEELIRITELWTDCSCSITEPDLRHMERLVAAQKRMSDRGGTQEPDKSPAGERGALTNG
ncbi:crotonase/enoyl-CoA hydratase family protein [Methylosinus sp. Sm6]|uniref:crotonase/enoyl-CoA hydratase family protein n=1 Tax=Methylosinus sp. Sm6 TaxID=2866948 RepID=UPI00351D5E63